MKIPNTWQPIEQEDWTNWKWQMQHRITDLTKLQKHVSLFPQEEEGFAAGNEFFSFAATPYYLSLVSEDISCPIRKQLLPVSAELEHSSQEREDPLAEERDMPIKGVTHRYPDRAIWYLSHTCAVFCRFCTRKRKVGQFQETPRKEEIDAALTYFRQNREIREVILSGGDPLTLSDQKLAFLLRELKAVPHINQIRIHTRYPVTLPFRITESLCETLKEFFPLYIVTHFNHAKECTTEAKSAIKALITQANCIVLNQSVLLSGVNDSVTEMQDLLYTLTGMGVKPYYIHQCDEVFGSSHFRVPIAKGIRLMKSLRGQISGLCNPLYVVDLTGGGGKVPVPLDYLESITEAGYQFHNFRQETYVVGH
ncbi:MAG: KamA family radical SAM protein [Spirochaetota bacterium]